MFALPAILGHCVYKMQISDYTFCEICLCRYYIRLNAKMQTKSSLEWRIEANG